jgi:putative nucleotidyltransferase with HDIG domain
MNNSPNNIFRAHNNADNPGYDKSFRAMRGRTLIFIITVAVCALFFSFHLNEQVYETRLYNLAPGYTWTDQSVKAAFPFSVYRNEAEYNSEVKKAKREALQVFILEEPSLENIKKTLDASRSQMDKIKKNIQETNKNSKKKIKSQESFEIIENTRFKKIETLVTKFLGDIYQKGFVNLSRDLINPEISVRVISSHIEKIYVKPDLTDSNLFLEKASLFFNEQLNDLDAEIALNVAKQLMIPNIIFSQELTHRSRKIAEESVPKTQGIVREGEIIVAKGQQINDETIKKLKSYERSKMNAAIDKSTVLGVIGSIGHAALIYSILVIYLFIIRKKIFYNTFQLGLISFFLILSSFLTWLTLQMQTNLPLEYLVIIPALSTLGAIVFDSRTAFYITVTMSLMFAGIRGNDYDAGTAMLFAGTLAAYTVRDIQSRTQVFKSMFVIFLGFAIPALFFGLERSAEASQILSKIITIAINSAISPLLTFGLLFLLERVSNITTDLRLQEYSNLNHPLLLKLNEIAPGTYQHTMAVAMLSEKCAAAIGAHELLAKVGAYFHDIGKVAKPEYFVENQLGIDNKHDLLPPRKSAAAIRNHVLEGIRLAKEYKLPQRIIDFIPMHHGTTLIKYFYAKAIEDAEDKSTINEADFRYSGPKPNSKEAAILMICDTAEALSRVASTDKNKLETALSALIHERFMDGQFDECDLNFKDLTVIKDTCIRNLTAAAHPRVEYKEIKKD